MTDIFLQETTIIAAAESRMLTLGQEAAQRVLVGKEPTKQDKRAATILMYLMAYYIKGTLDTKEVEAILYVLYEFAELNVAPTIDLLANVDKIKFYEALFYGDDYE